MKKSPLTGVEGADPLGIFRDDAPVVEAANVALPGKINGLAIVRMVDPPRDGVDVLLTI